MEEKVELTIMQVEYWVAHKEQVGFPLVVPKVSEQCICRERYLFKKQVKL